MKEKFHVYIVQISQGILLCADKDDYRFMTDNVKDISQKIYKTYGEYSSDFTWKFFPYLKLVRCFRSYQYHFLVVRKDYS